MDNPSDAIRLICETLSRDGELAAAAVARRDYPLALLSPKATRNYNEATCIRIFRRDGYIDRYSGLRLVFPPVLRILSLKLPAEFPFHPNWKMDRTHPSYWNLFPTIDHLIPVARGGPDAEENLLTTSMLRNSAKANWTLEDLGWELHPRGSLKDWDGLEAWCIQYVERDASLKSQRYIMTWCNAAKRHSEPAR